MKELSEIRKEIFTVGKDKSLFCDLSFQEVCFYLTCAAESGYLYLLSPSVIMQGNIGHAQDRIRAGYVDSLKRAFRLSAQGKAFSIPLVNRDLLNDAVYEIRETDSFNYIRHAFDLYDLKRYNATVISGTEIVFSNNETARDYAADVYNHLIDDIKPDSYATERQEAFNTIAKMLVMPSSDKPLWNLHQNKPTDNNIFRKYYKKAYGKVVADCDEKDDLDFGLFTLNDFRKVYAALMTLGVLRFNTIYSALIDGKKESYDINRPVVYGKYNWLKQYISRMIKCDVNIVDDILKYLTYHPETNKDRATIIQPLFVFDDNFFFSPSIVLLSYPQDKFLFVLRKSGKFKSEFSQLAKLREIQMTDDICNYIESNSNLFCKRNYQIIANGKTKAEFDLLIFDKEHNKLLLCELKWYFKPDNEFDHAQIDKKITDAIESRVEKEKIAREHIRSIMSDLFGTSATPEIMSCILSKNYSGSANVKDQIPVFDDFLFKYTIERNNFDLSLLFETLKFKSYLPTLKELRIESSSTSIEYGGFTVEIPAWRKVTD